MITSLRSPNSGNFAKKQQNSSSSVTHFTTAKTTKVSSSSSISNKHLFNEPSGAEKNGSDPAGSENSDDDILHVVTNVYTIPIIKSTSAGNGPFILGSTKEINVTTSCNEQFLANDHCQKSSNLLTSSNSVPVVLGEPINYKKTEYSSGQVPTHLAEQGGNKSKFQIRSIVEIYENPIEEQEQDKCTLKNSGYFEETTTKEIITEGKMSFSKIENILTFNTLECRCCLVFSLTFFVPLSVYSSRYLYHLTNVHQIKNSYHLT